MRKIISLLISFFLVSCFMVNLSAHSGNLAYYFDTAQIPKYINDFNDNVYYIGNENIGWSLNQNAHTNGNVLSYRFSDDSSVALDSDLRLLFQSATLLWDDVVTCPQLPSGPGFVQLDYDYDGDYNAYCDIAQVDSSGHFTKWTIAINYYYYRNASDAQITLTFAHELGHTIGLNDLYDSQNYNKIMCGYGNVRTATAPTSYDIWGARVITGQHATHRWTQTAAKHICTMCYGLGSHTPTRGTLFTSKGASGHTVYCSVCNYTFTESHSNYYNQTTGRCSACGYTDSIQLSVGDQTE